MIGKVITWIHCGGKKTGIVYGQEGDKLLVLVIKVGCPYPARTEISKDEPSLEVHADLDAIDRDIGEEIDKRFKHADQG